MKIVIEIPDDFDHDDIDIETLVSEYLMDQGVEFDTENPTPTHTVLKVTGPLAVDEEDE